MRKLKRILSIIFMICLLLSLAAFAFADEDENSKFKDKTWDELVQDFLAEYSIGEDNVTMGYYNTVSGEEHYYNEGKYMAAASMYKVPLNMAFAEKVYNGELEQDSLVGGVSLDYLREETIINSNNDYATLMWKELSGYNYWNFRTVIAPLMGVDPDTADPKYYENNYFTPEQMIHCLKELYTNSEHYPKVIETMQRAEPEKYFKQNEQRFDIAHKYGFIQEEYHLYINDCGIAYTDEPILLVIFTDNQHNAFDVITAFCTLMCDYTQYNTPLRLAAEQQAAAETAVPETQAPAATEPPQASAAPTQSPVINSEGNDKNMNFSSILISIVIVLVTLGAIAALIICKRQNKLNIVYAMLAAILAGAAMLVCVIGSSTGVLVAKTSGDPQQAVQAFFTAIDSGDYLSAYTYLKDYSTLGLENEPEDEVSLLISTELKNSYSYALLGECSVNMLEAQQTVSFTHFNLPAIEEDVQTETMKVLEQFVAERPRNKLYDADNNYLPEVAQEAYLVAVKNVLADAQDYYKTISFTVNLEYINQAWQIVPEQELLRALSGGAY